MSEFDWAVLVSLFKWVSAFAIIAASVMVGLWVFRKKAPYRCRQCGTMVQENDLPHSCDGIY